MTTGSVMAAGVKRLDFLLQEHCRIAYPLFIEGPTEIDLSHVIASEDWRRIRQQQIASSGAGADRYNSDQHYRRYLSWVREGKLHSVESLLRVFDFGRFRRPIELGCGDMPQAYTIIARFPTIEYTATDFDSHVIECCARLPILGGIRKFVFDVTRDDLDALKNYDLVLSWSLEFSLQDDQLLKLFRACSNHSVPYLLCSHTTIGPLGYLYWAYIARKQKVQGGGNCLRLFGWMRSVAELTRLAESAGMRLQWSSYCVNHAVLFFVPALWPNSRRNETTR